MRFALLSGSLLALFAALLAMWSHRFERTPGFPVWSLADLQRECPPVEGVEWSETSVRPHLKLHVGPGGGPVALRLAIPGSPDVEGLHLRFRLDSHGLAPGVEKWEDGRFMVEWHLLGHKDPEKNPVGSARFDTAERRGDLVVMPLHGPAVPALRIEHLGRGGDFELSELEITPVRERPLWTVGRWVLALAWMAWFAAFQNSWAGLARWRRIFAAMIWVALATQFVVPGPWKLQRPLLTAFRFGETPAEASARPRDPRSDISTADRAPLKSGPAVVLGKVPDQGSLVLRVKLAVKTARPLLHALLLFGPALALLLLVGQRPGLLLAALLAVSIELAQIAFGYGFDLVDVGDLACDAFGVALAFLIWKRIPWKPGGSSKRARSIMG